MSFPEPNEIADAYKAAFDTPAGRIVLRDLKRVANLTRIDPNHPDQAAALYRVAQLDLVRRIEKMSGASAD